MAITKQYIIINLLIFFLSINLNSQNLNENLVYNSLEKSKREIYYSKTIKIISILDSKNLKELKKIDQFAAQFKNKNVVFIAITDNDKEKLKYTIQNEISHYQQLSKEENKLVFNNYQTGMFKVFPIHVIINEKGKVIYKKKGNTNNIENKLAKRIDKLLKSNTSDLKYKNLQFTSR